MGLCLRSVAQYCSVAMHLVRPASNPSRTCLKHSISALTNGILRLRPGVDDCTSECNPIGCPDGYTLIKSAHNVECNHGKRGMSVSAGLCVLLVTRLPQRLLLENGADSILCPDSGCTTSQCCADGDIAGFDKHLGRRNSRKQTPGVVQDGSSFQSSSYDRTQGAYGYNITHNLT